MTAHITAQRADHGIPIRTSCRALDVSESWYYKHRNRPATVRSTRHAELVEAIWKSYKESGFTYGSPRVVLDLWEAGWKVSVNTVADIMADYSWAGRKRPARRSLTRQGKRKAVPDLVKRSFVADQRDEVWCGDVTMINTGQGPLYLATVIDLYSRRCLGFAMSAQHDQELTIASLQMAIATRGGRVCDTVWHTDRGSEYTGQAHAAACERMGLTQSMGRVASALDNSVAESFNSTLKIEFIYRRFFKTRAEARQQTGAWIDQFYNTRRHSWCGGISPVKFEKQDQQLIQDQPRSAAA
jgi:transposase InsO family protein